ncbi:MAG: acetyl-CoA C-acetyltransferase [Acidobacteria bacterium]|nr:acetyl-CoA C-acetyltransferase [Acidobacteriota bacterium]MBI3656580.1 acetyl-CoA C-acetyltransferase [Acidobacteriota bacterium]
MATAYIIDAVRTPRGRGKAGKGALYGIHPQELLAQALNHLADRTGLNKSDADDLVIGCVSQVNDQGANIAKNALLAADWPLEISGVTLNRFCGSGLQAVNFAAMGIMSGMQDLVVGGGVESMSRVTIGSDGAGIDGNNSALRNKHFQVPQGISADLIATLDGYTREDLDRYALESQKRTRLAQQQGWFKRSLFPIRDPNTNCIVLEVDEIPRPDTTLEGLAGLEPSFTILGAAALGANGETLDQLAINRYPKVQAIRHVHTAGNSSGIVDGAAVVALASEAYVNRHGLKPRARIRSLATCASEPIIMLTAPTPASQRALAKAGMTARDIDLWEINEAFAVVPLQTMRNLRLDHERVNVNGGAIALGHPLGATGAILLGTALDELERRGLATALITLCIGGGQGIATIIERV